ncbi:hypothetical protein QTP70_012527 [Hemibagrus guttatus]|uniref:ribonuclease H n=1 Tax=Hemibagrus guttatus TaxID=175788 RepID=A0AAE0UHW9_9TELE|nr:hypothetical protein QTP70_012527 [Hemibagrus guttatus]
MERRKVDILCVQETRWKGSKAHSIGAGFKLFYYGVDSKSNGVGVILKEEFVRNVLEVKRVSDRVMSLKLEIEVVMLNVVSGYAPQVGCELEEKERFWSELDEVMESIPTGERVVIGADFNGHVGEGNTSDEEVMGKFGVKERNLEGQMVVDVAKRMDMGVVNTYFQKREEHRVTYKSGGRSTQVDYILCRRGNLKEISDCKVVVGESVARQHRMVVCRMTLMVCKTKSRSDQGDWVLGVSSGRRKEDKETWWWNEEVQDSIQRKRLAKKKWDMDRTEENRQEYKELQRRVKREVSKAKQKAYDELYTRLDTREGEKDLYRLARQRDRDGKDVQQVRVIKDRDGRVLTSEESVQRRWKEYFEELMNEENEREKRVEGVNSVEQKVDKIRKDEVRKALKRMKSGKAVGPDDIPVEVWKCLGEAAVEFLASLFNRVLESERMPEEWRRSVLVPIFKNKGDVQSCSNYRGIKLMSHTMKVWERVVEARLRKVVEICEQQYGFMPRKSTTDAIFALRILMEKYRDGQRELHCVFVDLEKAYDRVPREELWYCMRKSGVAEKYVRVVQDMYERSRTVVRCAVGQTEEFNVEVGLHQGSALSPFLFAIVMDQLSEEVRQESPWTMMFADDIVICSESREQVEENLERWRFALERRGMKVSRSKTEYMCVNEREGSGTVRLQGEEVKKVEEFKYLGSTVQSNGECGKEVKKRVQAGWNGWRKVSGVLCDQKISARIKGKVYRTVVRPAMLYGLETVSLRKRQESELEVAELKMLRFSLGVTRLDRIRNEYIRGTAPVGRLGDKVREDRLRWFGHVQRRENQPECSEKNYKTNDIKKELGLGSDGGAPKQEHLIEKLSLLGLNTSLCNWILDFQTGRPQSVRIGNSISSTTTLSTGAPQGYVLSPLLFTLLTYDCAAMHSSNHIKFADDTTVVGLISKNDETLQRIVRTVEKIIGVSLPSITDIYTTRSIPKAYSIDIQELFEQVSPIISQHKEDGHPQSIYNQLAHLWKLQPMTMWYSFFQVPTTCVASTSASTPVPTVGDGGVVCSVHRVVEMVVHWVMVLVEVVVQWVMVLVEVVVQWVMVLVEVVVQWVMVLVEVVVQWVRVLVEVVVQWVMVLVEVVVQWVRVLVEVVVQWVMVLVEVVVQWVRVLVEVVVQWVMVLVEVVVQWVMVLVEVVVQWVMVLVEVGRGSG